MGPLKRCLRLGLRVLVIPLVHGGLSVYGLAEGSDCVKKSHIYEVLLVNCVHNTEGQK